MLKRFPRCSDIAHHASDYSDHTMPWSQALGHRIHLLICAHCRTFVRHLRTTITFTHALRDKDAPSAVRIAEIVNHTINANESKT